jgi:hypothetical protein
VQEASSVQMLRGHLRVAVERPAPPVDQGAPVSTSEAGVHVPPLQLGQIVAAKVIEPLPGGRSLIAIEGTLLEAVAPAGLTAGAELALRVEQLTPTLTLQMLSSGANDEADILHILRTRLPNFAAAGDVLQTVRQELRRLSAQLPIAESFPRTAKLHDFLTRLLPEDGVPNAPQLAAYLRHGGQFYEAKLAQQAATHPATMAAIAEQDVKGLLLGALQELATAPEPSTTAELATAIRRHLDHIESQQGLRLMAQKHDQPFSLQVPVWLGQAFATLMLAVDRDRPEEHDGKGRGSGSYRVLFLLDLDGLGQTRIEAQATAQALRVVFYIEQQAALRVLQEELPTLQRALQDMGYTEVLVDARPLAGLSLEERHSSAACAVAVPVGVNLVDVKV